MYGIIYKVTNIDNNKVYIGQTIRSLEERKNQHISEARRSNFYFHQAIKKHGIDAFLWEQIDIANNAKELNEKEIFWISFYNSFIDHTKGYNDDSGGKNGKLSEETKKKISEKLKGKKKNFSKEGYENKRKASANRVWTEESREKLRKSMTGKKHSEETKKKMSISQQKPKKSKEGYYKYWTKERREERSKKYSEENNPNYKKNV